MAAVADGERRGIATGERIGTMTLVRGGLARLRAEAPAALGLWLAVSAISVVVELVAVAADVNPDAPVVSAGYLGYLLASAAVTSVGSVLALRLFIQGRPGLLRLDRGAGEAAALLLGITVLISGTAGAYAAAMASPARTPQEALGAGLVGAVAYLALAYVMLKVTLWPIGRLTGRLDVTLGRSWRLMRKATRGLVLAYLLAAIPMLVLGGVLGAAGLVDEGLTSTVSVIALQVVSSAYVVIGYAAVATLWTLRVENPATVADVFD